MKTTLIITPFLDDAEKARKYAELCLKDSHRRGELPFSLILGAVGVAAKQTSIIQRRLVEQGSMAIFYTDLGTTFEMRVLLDSLTVNNKGFITRQLGDVPTLEDNKVLEERKDWLSFDEPDLSFSAYPDGSVTVAFYSELGLHSETLSPDQVTKLKSWLERC